MPSAFTPADHLFPVDSACPAHPLSPAPADQADPALIALGTMLLRHGYRHTTVSPLTHSRVNARAANVSANNLNDIFGWSRPFYPHIMPVASFELLRQADVVKQDGLAWRSTLRMSSLGQQLYFHSAYPTDDADSVFFGPDTYRFVRALNTELATLAQGVTRAIDIGCGAGPGAIAIALACPQAEVIAADINHAALRLSAVNATLAGTLNVRAQHSNLLQAVDGEFDLIVSNPPYLIDHSERAYRHGGGDLGAGLSLDIVDAAVPQLAPGGTLLLYTGVAIVDGRDAFFDAVVERLRHADVEWRYEEIDPDVFGEELEQPAYAGTDRIAAVWLKVSKPFNLGDRSDD